MGQPVRRSILCTNKSREKVQKKEILLIAVVIVVVAIIFMLLKRTDRCHFELFLVAVLLLRLVLCRTLFVFRCCTGQGD